MLLNVPAGHAEQLACPVESAKVPAAQSVHEDWPDAPLVDVPRAHGVQLGEPVLENVPAMQVEQLAEPRASANVPAAQSVQLDAPVAPPVDVPAAQSEHEVLPVEGANEPAAHG